jgi:ribosomal protein S18 acetylase RimI-like enzyme
MRIVKSDENCFYNDFLPLIIDLDCGKKYNPDNQQHVEWLRNKVRISFIDYGAALCAFTDEGEPIGYIWYKHDTGLEGVRFSGKNASIIQMALFEKYQRQGIGTILLDAACQLIQSAGGECLYTDTYPDNDDSMMFYIKNKFIPVALLPGLNGVKDKGQVFMYKIF